MTGPGGDPLLDQLIRRAAARSDTIGLILGGSRGAGLGDQWSDYDVEWVLTDAAYQQRQGDAAPLDPAEADPRFDLSYTCPAELARIAAAPGWWTPGYAAAQVLLDTTGQVAAALESIVALSPEQADEQAASGFDAYLNAYYRSLKAWRRGNELGGRLQAAESLAHLARTLFALARRWPPYHDRLATQLHLLDHQGWPPGYLQATMLAILRSGDPALQQQLQAQAETLLRARSFGYIVDAWNGEIENVSAIQFSEASE